MCDGLVRLHVVQEVAEIIMGSGVGRVGLYRGLQNTHGFMPEGEAVIHGPLGRRGEMLSGRGGLALSLIQIAEVVMHHRMVGGCAVVALQGPPQHVNRLIPKSAIHVIRGQLEIRLRVVPHARGHMFQEPGGVVCVTGGRMGQIVLIHCEKIERIGGEHLEGESIGLLMPAEMAQNGRAHIGGFGVSGVGREAFIDLLQRRGEIASAAR